MHHPTTTVLLFITTTHGQVTPNIFPTLLSFSALVRGDPLRIYGKALRILKLESSREPTLKT